MEKILLICLNVFILNAVAFSQVVTVLPLQTESASVAYNEIQVSTPDGYPAYRPSGTWYNKSTGLPYSRAAFFNECSDGCFSMFNDFNHSFLSNNITVLNTIRGKYDETHPHGMLRYQDIHPDAVANHSTRNILGQLSQPGLQRRIALNADLMDLMEGDTMQVVITYRKTFSDNGKIMFYYNKSLQAFSAIDPRAGDFSIPVINAADSRQSRPFPRVRIYNGPLTLSQSVTTPAGISNQATSNAIQYLNSNLGGNGSTNALFFPLTGPADNLEHNIFITLVVTKSIYDAQETFSNMYAYIVPESLVLTPSNPSVGLTNDDATRQLDLMTASLVFPVAAFDPTSPNGAGSLRAHDPNYIRANTQCTNLCNPSTSFETHTYRIHFQNDGAGDADSIIVTAYIDKKYKMQSLNIIKGSVATKEHVRNQNFTWKVSSTGAWNVVVFKFKRFNTTSAPIVRLYGTRNVSNPESNQVTMGDIFFSLETLPQKVACFYSKASIVFNKERPVNTKLFTITCCTSRRKLTPVPTDTFR